MEVATPTGVIATVTNTPTGVIATVTNTPTGVIATVTNTPTGVIATVTNTPDISAEVEHLRDEVSRLEKLVRKLSHSSRPTSRSSNRSPCHSPRHSPIPQHTSDSLDRHSSQTSDSFCWYHQKFGRQIPVKLPGKALAATSVPGQNISHLFFNKDHL